MKKIIEITFGANDSDMESINIDIFRSSAFEEF